MQRKNGTHAVINIVIDCEDVVTDKIDRRHVAAGYALSLDEPAVSKKEKIG
jgi:hypothetical protein